MTVAQPVRDSIIEAVATQLAAIGSSTAFNTYPRTPDVYRTRKQANNARKYPFCFVGGAKEDYSRRNGSTGAYEKNLTLDVQYWDQWPSTADSEDAWLCRMVADVEYTLRDWTLGGMNIMLDINANARIPTDPSDGDRVCAVSFEIVSFYTQKRNDPTTRD